MRQDRRGACRSRVLDDTAEHVGSQVLARHFRAVVDPRLVPADDAGTRRRGMPIDPASAGGEASSRPVAREEDHASGRIRESRFHRRILRAHAHGTSEHLRIGEAKRLRLDRPIEHLPDRGNIKGD